MDKRLSRYNERLRRGEPMKYAWDASYLEFRAPIMNAEPMSKADLVFRRAEGKAMWWAGICHQRFGASCLSSTVIDDMPFVLVGDPEQVVRISDGPQFGDHPDHLI